MIRILPLLLLLSGCAYFKGTGTDASTLEVKQRCDVQLSQLARVHGLDDADVVEEVMVKPDCTIEIHFRQAIGDSLQIIESAGGEQILHGTQPAQPAPGITDILDPSSTTKPEEEEKNEQPE